MQLTYTVGINSHLRESNDLMTSFDGVEKHFSRNEIVIYIFKMCVCVCVNCDETFKNDIQQLDYEATHNSGTPHLKFLGLNISLGTTQ